MQITATWGVEEVAVEVEAECRTLAALKALLQDALPEVDVGTVRLEVGGRELTDDDDVCGLEAGSVVGLSATAAVLLREEGWEIDGHSFCCAAELGDVRRCGLYLAAGVPACTPAADEYDTGHAIPLHIACAHNQFEVVDLLLDHGAAIAAKNGDHDTPLHIACRRNSVEVVRLLLVRGSTTDEENHAGETPLHIACEHNYVEVVRLLLDRGCALDSTSLHDACLSNHVEVVTLLLDRGCAYDEKNSWQDTPLHYACQRKQVEVVRLLLDRGAAINPSNCVGETPLHVACNVNDVETAALLVDRGAVIPAGIDAVAQKTGDNEMITLLSRARTAS